MNGATFNSFPKRLPMDEYHHCNTDVAEGRQDKNEPSQSFLPCSRRNLLKRQLLFEAHRIRTCDDV